MLLLISNSYINYYVHVSSRNEEEASLAAFCTAVESNQFSGIIDLTWNGWNEVDVNSKVNSL